MPTPTITQVRAYAHCVRPRCPGYREQEVDAVRREDFYTYAEKGGDLPGIENSFVYLDFADEDERACPSCGQARDLSATARPQYQNISGHDPNGLLDIEPFDPHKQAEIRQQPVADEERQRMESENAELRERLARLEGFVMGQGGQPAGPEE